MKRIFHLLAIAVLVFIDQFTKFLVLNSDIAKGNSFTLIKGVFNFTYVENRGAVWGILNGKTALILFFAAIVMFMLLWIYIKTPDTKHYMPIRIIIIMTVSGALGNIIDRVRLKYVVDFLDFSLINFPVFNVADCYVTISVFMAVFLLFFYYKEEDLEVYSFSKKKQIP